MKTNDNKTDRIDAEIGDGRPRVPDYRTSSGVIGMVQIQMNGGEFERQKRIVEGRNNKILA